MKKKIFVLTVAILVLAFSLLSFTACTSFDKIKEKISDVLDEVVAIDDAGTSMYEGKTYDMPRALKFYASSPNSNKTVRLTATITPAAAADKTVDWSVAWSNPSSTWATGKTVTDYVTVTPTSDGALTADVHFVSNFGETILVTVSSREVPSLTASCYVSCLQDVSSLDSFTLGSPYSGSVVHAFSAGGTIDLPNIDFFYTSNYSLYHNDSGSPYCANPSVNVATSSTPYTMPVSYTGVCSVFVKRSDALGTALSQAFSNETTARDLFAASMSYTEVTKDSYDPSVNSDFPNFLGISVIDFYQVLFSGYLNKGNAYLINGQYYNKIVTGLQNTSGPHFSIKIVANFNQGVGSVTYEYDMRFSNGSLGLTATSVSLNQNSITF